MKFFFKYIFFNILFKGVDNKGNLEVLKKIKNIVPST